MKNKLINIVLFLCLHTAFCLYANDINKIKQDLVKKHGIERYQFLLSSISQTHKDSLYIRRDLLRFAIKKTDDDNIYLGRMYIELAKVLLNDNKPRNALDTIFLAREHINITNDSLALGNYYFILSKYYKNLTDFDKAITVIDTAIIIFKEINETTSLSLSYNSKGVYFHKKQDWSNGIKFYKKAEKINIEFNNKKLLYNTYCNLTLIYKNKKQYDEAVEYNKKAMLIAEELDIKLDVMSYFNLASLYMFANKDYLKAKNLLMPIYKDLENKIFNGSKASVDNIKHLKIKDSDEFFAFAVITQRIFAINYNLEDDSIVYYAKIAYGAIVALKDFELKKSGDIISTYKEKAILERKQLDTELKIKQQRLVIFIFLAFTILIILFLFFYYKANKKLDLKNRLIKKQQVNIIDSINYANRIQQSILLPETEIRKTLNDFFVYFKPRDIVSGDFYWYSVVNEIKIIAAIDCTGHGVPGAFMSMIGNTLLNEIVIEKGITDPGDILNHLHEAVITTLQQDKEGEHAQDGMDISLCAINQKKKEIKFAGAKNPVYFIMNDQIESIKGDAFSIGGMNAFSRKSIELGKKVDFTTKLINYSDGLSMYIFTDGYMDQYGSNNRRSFNTKRFKSMLLGLHKKDATTQKEIITENMNEWKGNTKQLDDMLVIGFKV